MHDIAKIGIPDSILFKPGRLEPDEWEIMTTHVNIGADLLDGSGYSNGLAGEAIPIEGRICAICDVFDTLTSEQPYIKAWSVREAITFLRQQKGRHFAPRLTEMFEIILDDILAYRAAHLDKLTDPAQPA